MNRSGSTTKIPSLLFILLLYFAAHLSAHAQTMADVLGEKRKRYAGLAANIDVPLAGRIATIPASLLETMIEYDTAGGMHAAPDYKPYTPSAVDRALITEYLDLLPPVYRETAERKLLRIYFIDNFAGGAFTDWLMTPDGEVLYYIILNSATLEKSLGEWLTLREDAIFEASDNEQFVISVSGEYRAALYALLHEISHIVDYELGITPYMDKWHKQLKQRNNEPTSFTRDIWVEQKRPLDRFQLFKNDEANFYGMYKDKPLIPRNEAPAILRKLRATPFVSLYASTIWYEDFADFATWHHLSHKLELRITVSLRKDGVDRLCYQPMKSRPVKKRSAIMEQFY